MGGGLPSPFQPGQVTQRMLYEVGGPGLRQASDNGVEAAPDCLMRRSASASPYASVSDFQADTYTQANMGPPKKPMCAPPPLPRSRPVPVCTPSRTPRLSS